MGSSVNEREPLAGGEPTVTVVIPAWGTHAVAQLGHAVDSARHVKARILVVDNADDSPVTASCEILRLPSRVSIGEARNAALHEIGTPYVLFLDADDELLPGALDHLLELVNTTGPRPILASARLRDSVSGSEYHWPRDWQRRMTAHHRLFAVLEAARAAFPVQGSLLPTDAVRDCGGYAKAEDAAEDWVLGASLVWRCDIRPAAQLTMQYSPTIGGRWNAAAGLRCQLAHRKHVRERLRNDPQARPLRVWLPLLGVVQTLGAVRDWGISALRVSGRSVEA